MKTRFKQLAATGLLIAGLSVASANLSAQTKTPPPDPKIKVGDVAPDFTLTDTSGKPVSLHDFKGKKNVALAFYVFAFTGG
jgi:cytochrome oxidase Cu insertion factor (SCO1/SenC/PrrC family)